MNGQMGFDDERAPEPRPAAMNAVGSSTGRVMRDAPEASVGAALSVDAKGQREGLAVALRASDGGLTSIELAAMGKVPNPNIAGARLQELWEAERAYVVREHGRCVLGQCHEHVKERKGHAHLPMAPCDTHGKPLRHGRAAIWRSL